MFLHCRCFVVVLQELEVEMNYPPPPESGQVPEDESETKLMKMMRKGLPMNRRGSTRIGEREATRSRKKKAMRSMMRTRKRTPVMTNMSCPTGEEEKAMT